jgi:hypothetical protein
MRDLQVVPERNALTTSVLTTLGRELHCLENWANVAPQGLAGLLFAALEVSGVSMAHVHPLEIPNEDLFVLCPATDAVGWQEFKSRSNILPDTDEEVLDDEVIIIRSSGPTSEPELF